MNATDEKAAAAGYFTISNRIVDSGLWALLSNPERSVLIVIIRHANFHSRQSWPCLDRLVNESGFGRGPVQRSIRNLISYGVIKKHRFMQGRKFKCVYTVIDKPEIALPNKSVSTASKREISREKGGKFGVQPCSRTTANKPFARSVTYKSVSTAYKNEKNRKDSDQKEADPPAPIQGSGSVLRPEPPPVSTDILRRMAKELGKVKALAYLRALRPNQPIPDFLRGGSEVLSPSPGPQDPEPAMDPHAPTVEDGSSQNEEARETLANDSRGLAEDSRIIDERSENSNETNPPDAPLGDPGEGVKCASREGNYCVA
jgi:hypothetical protein